MDEMVDEMMDEKMEMQTITPPEEKRGTKFAWLAPAFLVLLLAAFFISPGTTLEKFYMICFGI